MNRNKQSSTLDVWKMMIYIYTFYIVEEPSFAVLETNIVAIDAHNKTVNNPYVGAEHAPRSLSFLPG
jgi:hypothetical protein